MFRIASAGALALLCLGALFGGLAASAEEAAGSGEATVWSATLTVGAATSVAPAATGYQVWSAGYGELSADSFLVDGAGNRILGVFEFADGLYLLMSRELPHDFTLNVGGLEFEARDSLEPTSVARGRYWWAADQLSWAVGDLVELSIVVPAEAASLPERDPGPLTAYFTSVPTEHDGTSALSLRLLFTDDLPLSFKTLKGHAVQVAGGAVSKTKRVTKSSNLSWTITIVPDGSELITVQLVAPPDCEAQYAICTADGRPLANRPVVSISSAAALASDASLAAFSVSDLVLSPAFAAEDTLYTATAASHVEQVTVDAEATDSSAVVVITPADGDIGVAGHQVALPAGAATAVAVTVTAEDGVTVRQYWLVINREEAAGAGADDPGAAPQLSGLALGGLTALEFHEDTLSYQTAAQPGVAETTVVATPISTDSTVDVLTVRSDESLLSVDESDADAGADGHQASLSQSGDTLILVLVTSADGLRQQIYVVLVSASGAPAGLRSASELERALKKVQSRSTTMDVTLSALSLGDSSISPAFASGTPIYTASVEASVDQVTVSATATNANAEVLILPADADTGTAGHQVSLTETLPGGSSSMTTIAIVVRAADDSTLGAYTVTVTRAAPGNNDATLTALSIDGATLSPAFADDVYQYTTTLPGDVHQITVSATAADSNASVAFTPSTDAASADGHQVDLAVGINQIAVTVTAEDGQTTLEYEITAVRIRSSDAELSALALDGFDLSPAFNGSELSYTVVAANTTNKITVTATAKDSAASITITPEEDAGDTGSSGHQVPLSSGATTIVVKVSADDGVTTQTYRVFVLRPTTADDASLSGLAVNGYEIAPDFMSGQLWYHVDVGADVLQVTLAVAAADPDASIQVLPADADLLTAGHQVALPPLTIHESSETLIGIIVTSQDGVSSESYSVSVLRPPTAKEPNGILNFVLPQGCALEPLIESASMEQPRSQWRRTCESLFEFKSRSHRNDIGTGYARFYRVTVANTGSLTVRLTDWDTSHHYLLRDSDGKVVKHVFFHSEFPRYPQCLAWFGHECAYPSELVVDDLEPGEYVLELIQNYTHDDRQRAFTFEVQATPDTAGQQVLVLDNAPLLKSISFNGVKTHPQTFRFRVASPVTDGSLVTVVATPLHSASTVSIFPPDADTETPGHQLQTSVGLTEVWVSVTTTEASGAITNSYQVRVFGKPPPGEALTATISGVPERHNDERFHFTVEFSEPVRFPYLPFRNQPFRVKAGWIVNATPLNDTGDQWRIVFSPTAAHWSSFTLPSADSCIPGASVCSFFGKPLSNSIAIRVPY